MRVVVNVQSFFFHFFWPLVMLFGFQSKRVATPISFGFSESYTVLWMCVFFMLISEPISKPLSIHFKFTTTTKFWLDTLDVVHFVWIFWHIYVDVDGKHTEFMLYTQQKNIENATLFIFGIFQNVWTTLSVLMFHLRLWTLLAAFSIRLHVRSSVCTLMPLNY